MKKGLLKQASFILSGIVCSSSWQITVSVENKVCLCLYFPLSYTWTENTKDLWACGKLVSRTLGRRSLPLTWLCELRRWLWS